MTDPYDPYTLERLVCVLAVSFSVGLAMFFGISIGENSAIRQTVTKCVETPQECKIMYDFYQLSENKK